MQKKKVGVSWTYILPFLDTFLTESIHNSGGVKLMVFSFLPKNVHFILKKWNFGFVSEKCFAF